MKKQLLLVLTLLMALLLAACGDDAEDKSSENANDSESADTAEQAPKEVEITEDEQADAESAVVSVNGNEITGDKYNNIYKQLKTMLHMYGEDVSDLEMLKEETVAILVEQELIRKDAMESGIEVTEDDAQAEIDTIIDTNGEEALTAMLEQYEMTEDEFRNQLMDDLITIKYIETEFDVEVTEAEIEEQYNLIKEQEEEVGELEEYEEQIRQSISEQKQGELLETRITELRENAEIETLI